MHPDTIIYYIRCGAATWGQGRPPADCSTSNDDYGPFFLDRDKALAELNHLQELQPENSYGLRETTIAEINAEQTEFAGAWQEFFLAKKSKKYLVPAIPNLAEYLNNRGVICPFCNGSNLDGTGVTIDAGNATQTVTCLDCHKSWTDYYTLTGVIYNKEEQMKGD